MNAHLQKKLADLPITPGIYFYKDRSGETIYIGKAANLRSRVRQYFQKSRTRDPKTDALIAEIHSFQWRELDSEADALFLEAELVRRYQPRYNIMLRDDKSLLYVRIDYKSDYPIVTTLRRPLDDGATYFGPYLNGYAVKKALRYLRRAFPYATTKVKIGKRASLHYHLGMDPGLEEGRTSLADYRANLRCLMRYLRGERAELVRAIEKDMKKQAASHNFEAAAKSRNQLFAIRSLGKQVLFGDRENLDLTLDEALSGLADLLNLSSPPRRIEAFDISHFAGRDTVASMVVFTNGVPDKTAYRKFKMSNQRNDDFANMKETLSRRLSERNVAKWPIPELVIIDGGKGQLSAALSAREITSQSKVPMIGLAKRFEELIVDTGSSLPAGSKNLDEKTRAMGGHLSSSDKFAVIALPTNSPTIKLLQRIRDESHRFAVSYHESLARTRQTASILDSVPGVGPQTKKKLISHFGSTAQAINASETELIKLLGAKKGQKLFLHLKATQPTS